MNSSRLLKLAYVALCAGLLPGTSHAQTPRSRLQMHYLAPATDTLAVTVEMKGRSMSFATAYRTVRRVRHSGRAAVELTYQWRGNDGSATADTLWVDASDLTPLENHLHNGSQDAKTVFGPSAARTRYTLTRGREQRADTVVDRRLYASAELEDLIRLAPLAPGYSADYTLYYGPPGRIVRPVHFRVVRSETVTGRNGQPFECWVVDAALPEGLNTFYVSKVNRRVVRLVNHEDPSAAFVFTR